MTDGAWREALASWPRFAPTFELDPHTTALVLVDMQKGYLEPDSGLVGYLRENRPDAAEYYLSRVQRQVIPNHRRMLEFFRRHELPVIYVTFAAHLPSAADWLPLRRQRDEEIEAHSGKRTAVLYQGMEEAQVIDELAPRAGELVINKVSRGAFNSTGMEALLRNMGVTGLVVAGVVTNVCVETTARDAADRGFKVVLVDDACASYTQAAHDACMQVFAAIFGQVMETEEILATLEGLLATGEVKNED